MKLVYLGTSAAAPTPERSLTCICLVRENEVLMFDAGEGAQVAYLKAGLPWNKKNENICHTSSWRSLFRNFRIIANNVNAKKNREFRNLWSSRD